MNEARYSYSYARGWCIQCGRRRGADGRCPHCDPWWTSPVLQAGAPLAALTLIGLVGLLSAFAPVPAPPSAERPRAASPTASSASRATPMTPAAPMAFAPRLASAAAPMRAFSGLEKDGSGMALSPEARLLAQLEELRAKVWTADAVARGRVSSMPTPQTQVSTDAATPAPPEADSAPTPTETAPS